MRLVYSSITNIKIWLKVINDKNHKQRYIKWLDIQKVDNKEWDQNQESK